MKKLLIAVLLILASPAFAQDSGILRGGGIKSSPVKPSLNLPIDPLGLNKSGLSDASGNFDDADDLLKKFDTAALADGQYALKIATAANLKLTVPCLQEVVNRLQARVDATKDTDIPPEPALMTKAVRIIIVFNAFDPEGDLMVKCAPLANKVKMTGRAMLGEILSGGIGLTKILGAGL